MRQLFKAGLAGIALLALAACQPAEQAAQDEAQTLEERAQARWNLMAEGDFAQAWEYYTPGFRQRVERDIYVSDMRTRPVTWLGGQVLGSECEQDDRCLVTVEVSYRADVPGMRQARSQMELTRPIEDEWIRLDGQWWYVQN